jgi:hypothetical protein
MRDEQTRQKLSNPHGNCFAFTYFLHKFIGIVSIMKNQGFTIYYNGKNVSVTDMGDKAFLAQITYKPIYLKIFISDDGSKRWIDLEMNMETMLSHEIGGLIEKHPSFNNSISNEPASNFV